MATHDLNLWSTFKFVVDRNNKFDSVDHEYHDDHG